MSLDTSHALKVRVRVVWMGLWGTCYVLVACGEELDAVKGCFLALRALP
jgi:hypothetical protein